MAWTYYMGHDILFLNVLISTIYNAVAIVIKLQ